MERKRKELVELCHTHGCLSCPLGGDKFKCGKRYAFSVREGEEGYITEAEVDEAYKLAFPQKSMFADYCAICINRNRCENDDDFRDACFYNGLSAPAQFKQVEIENLEEKPSTREEILREAIKCVCTDRNEQYGEPEDSFRMIGDLWGRYIAEKCLDVCTDVNGESCCHVEILPEDVAMLMVLFKVCRGATGEKITKDTLVDIAGYAACAGGLIEDE